MSHYFLIPLLALLINVFIIGYLFSLKGKSRATKSYLIYAIVLGLWILGDLISALPGSQSIAILRLKIISFAWISIGFLFLNFVYIFLRKKRNLLYFVFLLSTIVGCILSLSTDLIIRGYTYFPWGVNLISGVLFLPLLFTVIITPMVYALYLLIRARRKTKFLAEKKQFSLLIFGTSVAYVFTFIFNALLPYILEIDIMEIGSSITTIQSILIFFALIKFRFVTTGVEESSYNLFANSPYAVIILNLEGQILELNDAALRLLEIEYPEYFREHISIFIEKYKLRQHYKSFETTIHPGKNEKIISITSSVVRQSNREFGELVLINDITQQKHAIENLRASEKSYRNIFNASNDAILVMDKETRNIIDSNIMSRIMFGYTEEEMKSIHLESLSVGIAPHTYENIKNYLDKSIAEGPQIFEFLAKDKYGSAFWLEINIKQVVINSIPRILIILRNIHNQKLAYDELRIKESAIDSSINGIIIFDLNGRISYLNNAVLTMWRYRGAPEDLIGKKASDYYDDQEKIKQVIDTLYKNQSFLGEVTAQRLDGSHFNIMVSANLVLDDKRKPLGALASFVDITHIKQTEEQLKNAMIELQNSNRELEQFASTVSHDLNTPLTTISGYLQLIERKYKSRLDDRMENYINIILHRVNWMHKFINALLEYSRVGVQEKNFSLISLNEVINRALANLQMDIKDSQALIEFDDLPTIKGVDIQLVQLFQNLISNSIKFRNQAPPKIKISCQQQNGEYLLAFSDNGIGIEKQSQSMVFNMFKRGKDAQEYPGYGVGLALCKKIVEHHGGRIWLDSKEKKGTTFYLTLPLDKQLADSIRIKSGG